MPDPTNERLRTGDASAAETLPAAETAALGGVALMDKVGDETLAELRREIDSWRNPINPQTGLPYYPLVTQPTQYTRDQYNTPQYSMQAHWDPAAGRIVYTPTPK